MVDSRSFIEEDVCVILVVALRNPRLDLGIIEQVPCLRLTVLHVGGVVSSCKHIVITSASMYVGTGDSGLLISAHNNSNKVRRVCEGIQYDQKIFIIHPG